MFVSHIYVSLSLNAVKKKSSGKDKKNQSINQSIKRKPDKTVGSFTHLPRNVSLGDGACRSGELRAQTREPECLGLNCVALGII